MSPDRLWSFLWGWAAIVASTDVEGAKCEHMVLETTHSMHACECIDMHVPCTHTNRGFRGTEKRPSCCAELPPTCSSGHRKYGPLERLVVHFCHRVPCTYIYHTPPAFFRSKKTDMGVENHKERKVGDWSREGGNWTSVDEGRWRNWHKGRGKSMRST